MHVKWRRPEQGRTFDACGWTAFAALKLFMNTSRFPDMFADISLHSASEHPLVDGGGAAGVLPQAADQ